MRSMEYNGREQEVRSEPPMEFCLEKEPGIKFASDNGFYGPGKSHILTYNQSQLRSCLSPFLSPDLTVFFSIFNWMKHIRLLVGSILFTLIVGYNEGAFPDTPMGQPACSEASPTVNRNICQLEDVLENATDHFQWLIAFLLSGFVAMSVAMWRERRTNYASLCGNARNLNLLLSSLIPMDPDDKFLCDSRKTLGRWVMLGFELAMLKARANMDSSEGKDYLLSCGLMEEGEWESMVNGDRHTTVFWWIALKVEEMRKEGYICVQYVTRITMSISSMRAQANDLMSSLNRDKPIPYTSICGFLVNCNLFVMTFWRSVEWSIWLHSFGGPDLFRSSKMWVDIFALFAWNLSYASLYDLGYVLENPFLDRRIDVAHETIFNGVRRLSTAFAQGDAHVPPALRKKKIV